MNLNLDAKYCPEIECRWKSYNVYKLMLWAWMMNEINLVISVALISHTGYYVHGALYLIGVVFVGIPMVYAEISIAQYTNHNILTMWNFCPLFRGVGYAYIFAINIKTIYLVVLAAWYLNYAFYSALDPPPWYDCSQFAKLDFKCMVKRVNTSLFQNCLEAAALFNADCGVKTASYIFYTTVISENNTTIFPYCLYPWKIVLSSSVILLFLFILSMKQNRYIQSAMKVYLFLILSVCFVLLCVAASTNGTWYATRFTVKWNSMDLVNTVKSIIRGFLSVGSGYGIIGYISQDVRFRSPSTMTAISVPLASGFFCLLFAMIVFSGIKTVSFFHGEEENIIELGYHTFFNPLASTAEILSYFESLQLWGFVWFSTILLCMFMVIWILFMFTNDLLQQNVLFFRQYATCGRFLHIIILAVLVCPFFCSDLTGILLDATEMMQSLNNFLFSIALFWIYGLNKLNVDIIFMIGIKASLYWKVLWALCPVVIGYLVIHRWMLTEDLNFSYEIGTDFYCDHLILYIILAIYFLIIIIGTLLELYSFYRYDSLSNIYTATDDWGPKDHILLKSRKMFIPQIMTREFLYRQVRICSYLKKKNDFKNKNVEERAREPSIESLQWSALTSN